MMDFVFCTDKNYLKGYGVLMLSILRFAPPQQTEGLRFHILSDDLDDADKATLEGIAARRENAKVCFYEPARLLSKETLKSIDDSLNANKTHITAAAFYRILAADLLPPDVHRALYLDGDTVCTGSLDYLFNVDLKGCVVGMCLFIEAAHLFTFNRLSYPPEDGYCISSLVLFDLDLWRKENVTRAMLGYLERNAKKLLWHDQDVINAVLHGRIFMLDYSADVLPSYYNVYYWLEEEKNKYYAMETQFLLKEEWGKLKAAVERPLIAHFQGPVKPWFKECAHPFAPVWRYFCAQSPWASDRLKSYVARLPLKKRLRWHGRRALEKLDLVTPGIPCPKEAYAIAQGVLDRLREGDRDSGAQRFRRSVTQYSK